MPMRRQRFAQCRQDGKIGGALACLVPKSRIAAARQQHFSDLGSVAFGGDHQCCAPARILKIDPRTGIKQVGDDLERLRLGDILVGTRRPHQERKVIGVTSVNVDIQCQQLLDYIKLAAGGRIDDRRLAGVIGRSPVGAVRQQHFDDRGPAGKGGCCHRRDATSPFEIGVGTSIDEPLHDGRLTAFCSRVQRS